MVANYVVPVFFGRVLNQREGDITRTAVVDGRQLFWKTNLKLFLCGFMVACMSALQCAVPFGTGAVCSIDLALSWRAFGFRPSGCDK